MTKELSNNPVPDRSHRSGFVCLVGRPNAGKSTLVNALVGSKVAITSAKPQTTRHAVRGVITRPDAQLVIIDTPGLSKPRSLLQERLNDLVRATYAEVDIVALCLPADQHVGSGDKYLIAQLLTLMQRPKLVAVVTKIDKVSGERLRCQLLQIDALSDELGLEWEHIVPCSAFSGMQLAEVTNTLISLLPVGPVYYPNGELSDEPDEVLVTELIREAALELVRDELPHSITVELVEMGVHADPAMKRPVLQVYANLIVERESQKHIMIGSRGERVKQVGTAARRAISALLSIPTRLDLRVKVVKEWQRDPKALNKLGFEAH
ncbi:MAG: GTPase Era [Propionibacteriaceae bacterium]|jgi:GTP-binding protein Era|nr:GTPase Era [Propionibacteriaceae bacterium]